MADGKNQNDQVQDLLARLRSQMSQLDEMFGLGDTKAQPADAPETPAVPEEADTAEEAPLAEAVEVTAQEEAPEEQEEQEEPWVPEDTEEAPADMTATLEEDVEEPALSLPGAEELEPPVQLDLFEEIDAAVKADEEEEATPIPETVVPEEAPTTSSVPFDFEDDPEDDAPVFSKDEVTLHIRKESIVAEILPEERVDDEREPVKPIVVTEIVDPHEAPREKTESHASCFVPSTASAEEEAASAALSPFSTERRFDPSKYDAMLADYEKRKSEAFEDREAPKDPVLPKAPVLPQTPILMPRTTTFVFPAYPELEEEEEDAGEELAEQTDASEEEPTSELFEDIVDIPVEESHEEPAEEPAPLPVEEPVKEPVKEPTPEPQTHARVVLAQGELSDTQRDSRSHASTGRVHLAPSAYRAVDERGHGKSRYSDNDEDEEDFMDGLPRGIRESLVGFPLGRPNRAQGWNFDAEEPQKVKKKRKAYRFPEELEGVRDEEDAAPGYVLHHLKETLKQTRARLIIIAVLSFVLLLLENISLVQGLVPPDFVEVQTAGIIDALLLLGVVIAAWPRLHVGLKGIFHGRVLPESILLVEAMLAFVYAIVLGALGEPTMYLSFVPALGLSLLYSFRVLRCETDLRTFEKIHAVGDKLIFSPVSKKEILPDANKKSAAEDSRVYRMQKTAAVKGFSERNGNVCEDEWLNLGILLGSVAVGVICFLIAYFVKNFVPTAAVRAALFGCFLSAPIVMLGVHVYSMHRADCAAGADSAIAGEATVREAVSVQAVAFEDIEAAPSSGVVLSGIRVHCDDPTAVFKYLTALYSHIGGPLCGRFSGMYSEKSAPPKASVELVQATRDGVSAIIDGAEIVVGNGQYLTGNSITPAYDPEDEKVLSDGRSGVLYIAVNGMVCMKFYMEHRISVAFEKSVLRLHRLGIAAILRTYDPNFNEKTVARSGVLRDCHAQVVGKTVGQRNDFYAEQADGGIVTAQNSTKLLRLLLLCFRTHHLIRFGKAYKLAATVLGGVASAILCILGIFAFLPSVYLALYHLILLAIHMLVVAIGVKLPEISEGK